MTWWRGYPWTPRPVWVPGWDHGITWRSNLVTPAVDPIASIDDVRDWWLRSFAGGVEDYEIGAMLLDATGMAEEATQRALMPQTWEMVLSGFPTGDIVLPRPPLIEILSVSHVDGDGVAQPLGGSPAEYDIDTSGHYACARIKPLYGASWPSSRGPVTIRYRAGYEDVNVPPMPMILRGIKLVVGELYKQRSLSTVGVTVNPSQLRLEHFWKPVVMA